MKNSSPACCAMMSCRSSVLGHRYSLTWLSKHLAAQFRNPWTSKRTGDGHQCIAQMLELYPCVFRNPAPLCFPICHELARHVTLQKRRRKKRNLWLLLFAFLYIYIPLSSRLHHFSSSADRHAACFYFQQSGWTDIEKLFLTVSTSPKRTVFLLL